MTTPYLPITIDDSWKSRQYVWFTLGPSSWIMDFVTTEVITVVD